MGGQDALQDYRNGYQISHLMNDNLLIVHCSVPSHMNRTNIEQNYMHEIFNFDSLQLVLYVLVDHHGSADQEISHRFR